MVENVLVGPWIYSARESNMPIVEELRMEVPPGPGNVWFISARRSARSFCTGCRMHATILQDRALSQVALCGAGSIAKQKQHKNRHNFF